jgi:hypothetical protein
MILSILEIRFKKKLLFLNICYLKKSVFSLIKPIAKLE